MADLDIHFLVSSPLPLLLQEMAGDEEVCHDSQQGWPGTQSMSYNERVTRIAGTQDLSVPETAAPAGQVSLPDIGVIPAFPSSETIKGSCCFIPGLIRSLREPDEGEPLETKWFCGYISTT